MEGFTLILAFLGFTFIGFLLGLLTAGLCRNSSDGISDSFVEYLDARDKYLDDLGCATYATIHGIKNMEKA